MLAHENRRCQHARHVESSAVDIGQNYPEIDLLGLRDYDSFPLFIAMFGKEEYSRARMLRGGEFPGYMHGRVLSSAEFEPAAEEWSKYATEHCACRRG